MKRVLAYILILFSLSATAGEITEKSKILQFSGHLNSISADFTQSKQLPNINKKFIAEGKVKFKKDNGIIWHQQKPTEYIFKATKDKFCYNDEIKDTNNLPHFQEIFSIINDVLSSNPSSLNKVFDTEYMENQKEWTLILSPNITELQEFLKSVEFIGNLKYLKKISINYISGMIITLDFSNTIVGEIDEISCK